MAEQGSLYLQIVKGRRVMPPAVARVAIRPAAAEQPPVNRRVEAAIWSLAIVGVLGAAVVLWNLPEILGSLR